MSAVVEAAFTLRPMRPEDLGAVLDIERDIYSHPWTPGNFRDSLHAGYGCWVMERGPVLVGYGVLMAGVEEAHLLNLSVARIWQRQGLGRELLAHFVALARQMEARMLFLEVRPSNRSARELYLDAGFRELSVRRAYYPADSGREDAILMGMDL